MTNNPEPLRARSLFGDKARGTLERRATDGLYSFAGSGLPVCLLWIGRERDGRTRPPTKAEAARAVRYGRVAAGLAIRTWSDPLDALADAKRLGFTPRNAHFYLQRKPRD